MKNLGCLGVAGVLVLVAIVAALSGTGVYNGLVNAQQQVDGQWANVQGAYQRRADLVPNLVATVKGSASFEQKTLEDVVKARAQVGQVNAQMTPSMLSDPQAMQRFQAAQDQLGGALGRLIAVSERYPDLKSTTAFRDLMTQLEGTENRINVERRRFNELAQDYNTRIRQVPAAWYIGLLRWKFPPRAYFQAQPGSENAPKVDFGAS
jgi:LemA protein